MKSKTHIALFILLLTQSAAARQTLSPTLLPDLTGKVTNLKGDPLAGASIALKKGNGTVTNAKGVFHLKNIRADEILTVSFIGYVSQNIAIAGCTNIPVTLLPATNNLDEVIVQGYGTTSKRTATGNIGKVSATEIAKHPLMNVMQILQGQIPGTSVTHVSGYTSSSVNIKIRGNNTIDNKLVSEPLYIIDGVPLTVLNLSNTEMVSGGANVSQGAIQTGLASPAGGQSPFYNLNPADIESIEVLKDADATAIYGSRAANGVILVTTKKGKAGKTQTEINVNTGISMITRFYNLLNTQQYIAMRREALANNGLPVDLSTAPDLVTWDTTRFTDWQKFSFGGTGQILNMQASLSGGSSQTSFRLGGGYSYQKDITAVSGGNSRTSFSFFLSHKSLDQKFNITWSGQYSSSKIDLISAGNAVLLPPNAPPVYEDHGRLNYKGWGLLSGNFIFGYLEQPYQSRTNLLNSSISLSYELLKGLSLKTAFGYNNSRTEQISKMPIASQNPDFNPKGSLNVGHTVFQNLIVEPQLEYSRFISKGRLTVLVGGTGQTNKTDGLLNSGINYTNDLLLNSINNAPNKIVVHNSGEYRYAGIFGRINYNWLNKYILNLNARRDGSSRFGAGRQFGNFGSVGAAWVFTEEKQLAALRFLSFGKIRASYGLTGSDQIGDYAYISLWQFGNGSYNGNTPVFPMRFSDSLLQWEVNRKLEIGLNIGLLKDRLTFEASWYRNRCNNQLVNLPTPAHSGFTSVITNTPANVQNIGWEFIASAKMIDRDNLQLNTRIIFSLNRNKLVSYPNFSQSPYKGRYEVGMPLNIQKYLHFTGVDPETGEYLFEDRSKDGNITFDLTGNTIDDRYPVTLDPKFSGSISTDLTYKNWSLSIFLYGRKQLGFNAMTATDLAGTKNNQSTAVLQRWQKPGDHTVIGKFTTIPTTNTIQYTSYSDAKISDASFLRLQNVSLAYKLPDQLLKKASLNNCRVFIQGENLFLITSYKGVDPEIQNFGAMPRPTVITAGLSCSF